MANGKEYSVLEKIFSSPDYRPELAPFARPVNLKDKVVVKHGLDLLDIVNLDKSTGILTGIFVVYSSWTDQGLVWPSEDPDHVTIHPSKIWKPDTVLFNSVEIPEAVDKDALAVIKHTGQVIWCPRARLSVQCKKLDSGDWQAEFSFVSWVHNRNLVDFVIQDQGLDISFFNSSRYKVLRTSAERKEFECPLFSEPWCLVAYTMVVQEL